MNDNSLKEKIENIISNNCSRPGFDEYTRSADQILALLVEKLEGMKKYCHRHDTPKAGTVMLSPCAACEFNFPYNQAIADIIREVQK